MRCQYVDDDIQCRFDGTRRVLVASGDPPDPDQSGFAGTIYTVQVCKQHDPDPGGRCHCRAREPLPPSANVPGAEPSAEELHEIGVTGVHERPATRRYTTVGTKGDPSDAASEQRGQQAMRAIVLIPAAVAVILVVVYFVARGDDEDDDNRGSLVY
jgi:hypothetical protein